MCGSRREKRRGARSRSDLWAIAVASDDAIVVRVEGPFDKDSLEFQTRLQIRQIQELTGESWPDVVSKAIAQRYYRLREAIELLGPSPISPTHTKAK